MRSWKHLLVLALVAAGFCTPLFVNLGGTDLENDEAIYSYAVESVVETGDWLNPRAAPNPDVVFLEKPPLKFWIVALPIRLGLLPDNEFGLRFWDALFGAVAFLYIFALGRRIGGWLCGVVALLILYTFEGLIVSHGLRGNNMEASLVLAYAAGVYHYLRWTEAESPGRARAHAAAVGAYFFLGFMAKFVAALFLPVVLLAASLELPGVRSKIVREWRTWIAVAAGFLLVAAPWFVYQAASGRELWGIMFQQHVFQRFKGSLDPTHVHPWRFYFEYVYASLSQAHVLWIVLGGAALLHLRVVKARWLAGTLVLYWFWLPLVLISFGTSKLMHYTYPFLAPVAIAGGYLVASVCSAVQELAAGRRPGWMNARVAAFAERARRAWSDLTTSIGRRLPGPRPIWTAMRFVLLAAAAALTAFGWLAVVHPDSLAAVRQASGLPSQIRGEPALYAGLAALAVGLLAGRGAWASRLALPLVLLGFAALPAYPSLAPSFRSHPLRDLRDCGVSVHANERAFGRPSPDMVVYLRSGYGHQLYYYLRKLGWDWREKLPDPTLMQMLDDASYQRPVLIREDDYLTARRASGHPDAACRQVAVSEGVLLLLPGPWGTCAGP